jgi:hypothetical protein
MVIDQLRQAILGDGIVLTYHAAQEALEERISVDEIKEALLNGMILEDYPEHQRGACCLVYGKTNLGRDLHVVVTTGKSPVRVITVYEPRLPYWLTPTARGQR